VTKRSGKTWSVLLVEQNVLFRHALALALNHERDYCVVAQAGSLIEARRAFEGVDLVVIDPELPDGDGTLLIEALHLVSPHAHAVILTASLDPRDYVRAADAGASAVLHQSSSLSDVVAGLRRVVTDEWVLSARVAAGLLRLAAAQREQGRAASAALTQLSEREHAVFTALAEGLSDQRIAEKLSISMTMERTHLSRIQSKLGVHTRLQTLVFATRYGDAESEG